MNIKEGYLDDLKYRYDKYGNRYKKYDPSRKQTHRASDGLDNMIKEYARETFTIRSFCGEKEFNDVLKKCKRR